MPLFVISGPSGVGKLSIIQRLKPQIPNLVFPISATTRSARPGEIHGKDYFFVSTDEFKQRISSGFFLEWAEVHGNYYGTPRGEIDRMLKNHNNILLEIDVQGALQVKRTYPPAILIFVNPPSLAELQRRLRGRGTDSEEVIALRLHNASWEMNQAGRFDYTVVNDDLDRVASEALGLIISASEPSRRLSPSLVYDSAS